MRRVLMVAVAAMPAVLVAVLVGAVLQGTGPARSIGLAAARSSTRSSHGFDRFNVAATHSPELEKMLAGGSVRKAAAPGRSASSAGTTSSSASSVQGIDVASEQHPGGAAIDWADVATAGYKFAFIKVTEGSYYVNPYYASDTAGAQAAGMITAPYSFAIPNYSGGALQADYAVDNADYTPDGKLLPLILDIEYDPYVKEDGTNDCYGLTPGQMVTWIRAFVTEAQRRTGRYPIIYTTAQWWDECTGSSTAFGADPLWIAGYSTTSPSSLPAGWSNWAFWQYTSTASVPGISAADTDASYLSTTTLELATPASHSNRAGSTPASITVGALDGTSATPSYTAAGLPSGMSINQSSGVISGRLSSRTAPFRVSVTATAAGLHATQTFTWDVHGKVRLGALPGRGGSVGAPAYSRVSASDSLHGCTLTFSASGLPPGLTMNSCGLISGWLQVSGRYTVTVDVTDSSGAQLATGSFPWMVGAASGQGPTGQLKFAPDGKCLTELSTTDIAVEPCAASSSPAAAAQAWTVAGNGSIRQGGDCLAALPPSGTAPAALEVTACASGGQRWQVTSDAALQNLNDGRCLAGTGTASGSSAVAAACYATYNNTGSASTPGANQQWIVPAGPLTSGVAGFCASDRHGGAPLGRVTLRMCNGSAQQAWTIEPDGSVRIAGRCLGLYGGSTAPGTRVWLNVCRHGPTQVWQLSGGPIGIELVSPVSGLCLADPHQATKAGTALVIGPCVAGDPGITWRVS